MKIILITLTLILSSCTQRGPGLLQKKADVDDNIYMNLAPSTISLENVDNSLTGLIDGEASEISFDEVFVGSIVNKVITIKANSIY